MNRTDGHGEQLSICALTLCIYEITQVDFALFSELLILILGVCILLRV
jgi:hypothetical protein